MESLKRLTSILLVTLIISCVLNCVIAKADEFNIESVDNMLGGSRPSIALDSNGYPHISYDYQNELKYAKWTGTEWITEIVAYRNSSDIGGIMSSIALDSNDYPQIAYVENYTRDDGPLNHLKYARWTGTDWVIETVDNGIGRVGWCISLAIDETGNAYIAYGNGTNPDLKFAKRTESNWSHEIIDTVDGIAIHFTSIALDSDNNVHVCYTYLNQSWIGILKYAKRLGTNWNIETLETEENIGYGMSMAVDSHGFPHISYSVGWGVERNIEYTSGSSNGWNTESVGITHWGEFTSLALDSNDNPSISYCDQNFDNLGVLVDGNLTYARLDGSKWKTKVFDTNVLMSYTSMAIDNNSKAHICYWKSDKLMYALVSPSPSSEFILPILAIVISIAVIAIATTFYLKRKSKKPELKNEEPPPQTSS